MEYWKSGRERSETANEELEPWLKLSIDPLFINEPRYLKCRS
jgi:hypothetical protein